MEYRQIEFIGDEAKKEGWHGRVLKDKIGLENDSETVAIEIFSKEITVKIVGKGKVVIIREKKNAELGNNSRGKIKEEDIIWLLNERAKNEFNNGERQRFDGAAIKIEIENEKKEVKDERQSIFIKERAFTPKKINKNINLLLGGIVFTLLVVGTFLGYQKRIHSLQKIRIEEINNQINRIKTEIEGVRTMNIETALELAKEAELIIDNANITEKKYSQELNELKNEINEIKKGLGEESIDYEIAYDTGLIKDDGKFLGMAVKDNIVYVWSNNLGQINLIDIKEKSTEKIVADEKIKLWLGIFNNGEKWYGYDQDNIYEIKRNNLVESKIEENTNMTEIAGWNSAFYMLNNDNQNIEKLNGGEGRNWLREGISLKEEMVGISIDGSIWVLGKSGKIYHYNLGIEEEYIMSFLPSLTSAKKLRTNDQVNFLVYIIDNNNVIVYGKDGKISGKYNFGKIKINDIGIESQTPAILALADNGKIYRIKIK